MDCAICLERISNSTGTKLSCPHKFHHSCLASWLIENDNCPICRKDIGISQQPKEKSIVEIILTNGYILNEQEKYKIESFLELYIEAEEDKWDEVDTNLSSVFLEFKVGLRKQKKNIQFQIIKSIQKNHILFVLNVVYVRFWNYDRKPLKYYLRR